MGSKDAPPNYMNSMSARLHVVLANKKFAFFLSLVLATITFQATSPIGLLDTRQTNNKRKGIGGRDASGDLHSVLRRKVEGRVAVAIIRIIDNEIDQDEPTVKYLVQMKSHNYPIPSFRGSISLIGGNANEDDATRVDTLVRELTEELGFAGSLSWIHKIHQDKIVDESASLQIPYKKNAVNKGGHIRYLGLSMHTQTAKLVQQSHPYSFACALYEITLYPFQLPPNILYPRGATVQDGHLALLTEDQLIRHARYSWGYEYTMRAYFGRNVTNVCEGVSVEDIVESDLGDWTPEKK